MSKIKPVILTLEPSPDADVVGYRMYYVPSDSDSVPVDAINAAEEYFAPFIELDTTLKYDLSKRSALSKLDGTYDVGFTSIDARGNESDMGAFNENVPFDFVAPLPPVGATFSDE